MTHGRVGTGPHAQHSDRGRVVNVRLAAGLISLTLVLGACTIDGSGSTENQPPPPGLGGISESIPQGLGVPSDTSGRPVVPKITSNVTGAVPTNDWWSSLVWQRSPANPWSENMYPHPLTARAQSSGLELGYPTSVARSGNDAEYWLAHQRDLTLGANGLASPDTKVDGYGDWTVNALWNDGTRRLGVTLGHGLPFVYADVNGADAVIDLVAPATVWADLGSVRGITVNGHHWGLFAPSGSTWINDSPTRMRSSLGGHGYLSVAVLPDNTASTLNLFRSHAYAFVTSTQVSWQLDESGSAVRTDFSLATNAREGTETAPLLALYRHQWLDSSVPTTGLTYLSPRGQMKLAAVSGFETVTPYNGVLPELPSISGVDSQSLYALVDQVYREATLVPHHDTYWTGKDLGRLAQLVPIADQVGHTAARDRFLAAMKSTLEDWFTYVPGESGGFFAREPTWGTLIGYPASYGSDTELNDHHFHWGYFVSAAATVAMYDPSWAAPEAWRNRVDELINDAADGGRDGRYPFLRNYDPYEGHSWASGHGAFAAGNNQESSSEAINFAAAVLKWGAATGERETRDLGAYLYATEVQSIEQYWFDVDRAVFPSGWHETAGIVWGQGAAHATWWTADPEEIHGINMLPITGGSLYFGRHPEEVLRNYSELTSENPGVPTVWQDIIWSHLALADPSAALAALTSSSYTPEDGESRAHTYHWIATLAALGTLDSGVRANSVTAAVFTKAGQRTYVAWNPDSSSRTAQFSDGATLDVPAHSLSSSNGPSTTPTPTPTPSPTPSGVETISASPSPSTSPAPSPTPTSTSTRSAYSSIEAESYDSIAGITPISDSTASGGAAVAAIANGDWLAFRNVDFGATPPTRVDARVASGAGAGVSGLVEFRLDGPTGPKIADFSVANTGGWSSWTTVPGTVGAVTGSHDVYVVFASGQPADFVNFDKFVFVRP